MKIISLQSNNIKRLTAVNITPEGNVIQITGKNGGGKSSVLDSIEMALNGKAIPAEPIHEGESKASIVIDLGDLIVTRTFTDKGSYLKVESSDGAEYKSPQKMLDALVGKLSFDPLDFIRMKDADQFNTLAEYAGIDLTKLDNQHKALYTDRAAINKTIIFLKGELANNEVPDENAPDQEKDPSELITEIQLAMAANLTLKDHIDFIGRKKEILAEKDCLIESTKGLLVEMAIERDGLSKSIDQSIIEHNDMEHAEDVDALNGDLACINQFNEKVRTKKVYAEKRNVITDTVRDSEMITNQMKELKKTRGEMIEAVAMPIPDLGFGDGLVTYNNIPLSQASSAEQIRVTVAIAMAMNPKLRVIRIKDGSLLDSDSMKIIDDMAKDHDYQFWVERVDETGKVGILIEDGHIKSIDGVEYKEEVKEESVKPTKASKKKPKEQPKEKPKDMDQAEEPAKEPAVEKPIIPTKKVEPQPF